MGRSPCESYLKYLIVHPDGYDNDRIRSVVMMQRLDYMGHPYTDQLRLTCIPPNPFFPEDKKHKPSQRFLYRERLLTIFHPDDAMKCAWVLLESRAKETIENMVITKSNPAWICTALHHQGYESTPEAIERYKYYFFNIDGLESKELVATLSKRGVMDRSLDPDEIAFSTAIAVANRNDSRVMSAQAAVPALAGMMNLIRMGIMPTSVEISRIVKATQAVASYRALESALMDKPVKGRDYSFMVKMMDETLASMGGEEEELQEGLRNMILKTEETIIPHIKELSADNYTLDLQPQTIGEVDAGKK